MAQIGYKDIFADDIFGPVVKSAEDLLTKLLELENKLKNLGKSFASAMKEGLDSGDIQKAIQALEGLNKIQADGAKVVQQRKKAEDELAKIQKQLENINKQLAEAESGLAKDVERAKQALAQKRREIQELIKAEQSQRAVEKALRGEIGETFASYRELTQTLSDLKRAYKDLAAQGMENTEEGKKLKATIDELDERVKDIDKSVGEFQRLVGSYKESIVSALQEVAVVSVSVGTDIQVNIGRVLPLLAEGFVKAGQAAAKGGFGIRAFGDAIKVLGGTLKQSAILLLLDALVQVFQALAKWATSFGERAKIAEWAEAQKQILEAQRQVYFVEQKLLLARGEGVGKLREQAEWINELRIAQRNLYDAQLKALEIAEAELDSLRGQLDDADKLREFEQKRAEIAQRRLELEAARKRQDIELVQREAELREKIQEKVNRLNRELRWLNARGNEFAQALIDGAKAADDLRGRMAELIREFEGDTEAQARIRAAFGRAIVEAQREAREKFAKAVADARDTLIDGLTRLTASSFLINIRQVWSEAERATREYIDTARRLREDAKNPYVPAERRAELIRLAEAYEVLAKKSKEAAKAQIEGLFAKEIQDLQQKIIDLEADKVKALEFRQKVERDANERYFSELIQAIETEIAERKKRNESVDVLERQLSDIIDLRGRVRVALAAKQAGEMEALRRAEAEAEMRVYREALQAAQERAGMELEIQKKRAELYAATEKERVEMIAQIEADGLKKQIEQYQLYLAKLKELYERTGEDVVKAEMEATERRLELLGLRLAEATRESVRTSVKDISKSVSEALDVLDEVLDRADQMRLRKLDAEQRLLDKRLDIYRAAAEAGALSLEDSLALTEKQIEDIEKRRRGIERDMQRRQAFLSALQSYSAALQQTGNPQQALIQTLTNLSLLRSFIQGLPTFYEGTERVGSDNAVKIQGLVRDAFVVRVHEGERIVPAHINRQLGGVRNEDLPKAVKGGEMEVRYDKVADTIVEVLKKHGKVSKIRRSL